MPVEKKIQTLLAANLSESLATEVVTTTRIVGLNKSDLTRHALNNEIDRLAADRGLTRAEFLDLPPIW